jgi:ankyrin repeat protein
MSEFFDAIKQGQAEEVKRLLTLDPSLIHAKEEGLSPVLVAAYHQKPELANFLAEKKVSLTIYEAAATGKTDHIVRILAREPELVKVHAEDGFHALGLACFFGHYETAQYLIKAGAAVNSASRNDLQATPLHSATAADNLEIVDLLLANGADPNTREQGGFTPLHAAAQNGNLDIIRALIYGGADLDARGMDGKLPVDVALEAKQEEAAKLLLEGITRRTRARRANP